MKRFLRALALNIGILAVAVGGFELFAAGERWSDTLPLPWCIVLAPAFWLCLGLFGLLTWLSMQEDFW